MAQKLDTIGVSSVCLLYLGVADKRGREGKKKVKSRKLGMRDFTGGVENIYKRRGVLEGRRRKRGNIGESSSHKQKRALAPRPSA
jgi:hypothetical protein